MKYFHCPHGVLLFSRTLQLPVFYPCGAGQVSCCIGPQGNIYPCAGLRTVIGNLRTDDFGAIWRDSEELNRLRAIRLSDLEECAACELYAQCSRCAGLAEMESGSVLGISPQACKVTRALAGFYDQKRCELH